MNAATTTQTSIQTLTELANLYARYNIGGTVLRSVEEISQHIKTLAPTVNPKDVGCEEELAATIWNSESPLEAYGRYFPEAITLGELLPLLMYIGGQLVLPLYKALALPEMQRVVHSVCLEHDGFLQEAFCNTGEEKKRYFIKEYTLLNEDGTVVCTVQTAQRGPN